MLPTPLPASPLDRAATDALLARFLDRRAPGTRRVYEQGLRDFATFLGIPPGEGAPRDAARRFLSLDAGTAHGVALDYLRHLEAAGRAPATVAVRIAALRAIVRLARVTGVVAWTLELDGPRVEAVRQHRPPTPDGVAAMLVAAGRQRDPAKAARDVAILRVLHDLSLRRAELAALDLADLDVAAGTLHVRRKGRRGHAAETVPPDTLKALAAWLAHRGEEAGPLFVALDRARASRSARDGRLTTTALYLLVGRLGEATGRRVRPHDLRRAGVTSALDATGGDVRAAQAFAHHASVTTTMRYDHGRRDLAGETATLVAEQLTHAARKIEARRRIRATTEETIRPA